MLKELIITNLALIDKLHVSFADGLTVLTGETGAGKSIILQAIHLLGGGKAASSWVRNGAETASVEAFFELNASHTTLVERIGEMGVEFDEELVIKRNISQKGKSRYFINGSLATAKLVGEILENLLSVASQHDHQQLLHAKSHLDFIDVVGDLLPQRDGMADLYEKWYAVRKAYQELLAKEQDKEQRKDFLDFQCKEIEEAQLVPGEDEELTQERDRLRASDDLTSLGQKSYHLLSDAVGNQLSQVRKNLEQMAAFDQSLSEMSEEVAGHCFQLEDYQLQLRDYLETIPNDPSRLDSVTARIDLIQRLKRKYGESLDAVIAFGQKAREELDEIEALDDRLHELQASATQKEQEVLAAAKKLSDSRKTVAEELGKRVQQELSSLSFHGVDFTVQFKEGQGVVEKLTRHGWDQPEFVFSANPGEAPKPLAKVASGGELSRLMLALKCILAQKDQVTTVIFDEVDAGISGKAAEAVARKIKELSSHHQVLCITHLPQIASFATGHYLVEKQVVDARTCTMISQLAPKDRTQEIARMLDGDSITDQTLAYAQELISRNQ